MLYTSYFGYLRNLPNHVIPVSICLYPPDWYTGLQFRELAPSKDIFYEYKRTHDSDVFIRRYNEEVLKHLDPTHVVDAIQSKLPEWAVGVHINPVANVALLCFEKPTDLCHRQLVSKWFVDNGIRCKEYIRK